MERRQQLERSVQDLEVSLQRMQERLRAGHAELRSLQQRNATLREQERETARRLQAPEARAKEAVARQEETVLQMRHAGATVWEERRRQLAEEPSMLQGLASPFPDGVANALGMLEQIAALRYSRVSAPHPAPSAHQASPTPHGNLDEEGQWYLRGRAPYPRRAACNAEHNRRSRGSDAEAWDRGDRKSVV